jgi:N-acetylglucosaminyldiphosphoundecaprenol N-acetyl-beta-D-mannosaminyltransferase
MSKVGTQMLGVNIGSVSLKELTAEAFNAVEVAENQVTLACANPHSLIEAKRDQQFLSALNSSDQVVADGVGIVAIGKLVGLNIQPRITGNDYFHSVMDVMNEAGGKRVFFMGSTDAVLEKIQLKAVKKYPSLEKIGTYSPPFGDWSEAENQAVIDAVNEFKPDVLWVGMTAPKQEKWVHANRNKLNASVIGSIGAVFDFYAETHPRAPKWMHDNGLEWLYRLVREPRRMWRRNFVSTPKFIWMVIQEKLKNKPDQSTSAA